MAVTAAELNIRILTQGAAQAKADLASTGEAVRATSAGAVVSGAAMMGAGAGLLDFTKRMTEAGASYQQEMEFINALAAGTAQTSQMLQDEALKLDRTTIFSADQIATGMEQLAREGFTPLQIAGTNATNSLIQNSANMAAALRINMEDAANFLGMTTRVFADQGLTAEQTTNILTEAVLRSGKSASDFETAWQYVGIAAEQLHIPMEQAAAAVGLLESQGITASKAGTGLQQFLNGITTEGSKAQKAMAAVGISAIDAQGNFIGFLPLLSQLHDAYIKMNDSQKTAFAEALSGGQKASAAVKQLLQDGPQGITDFIGKMEGLGGAAKVMGTLMDNAAGSFKAFASSLETAKILMGEQIAPLLRPVTDGLRGLLGAFIQGPAALHAFAAAGIAGAGALLTLAGAFAIFKALNMGAAISDIVGSLAALAGPLLLVAALAGAFYLAWNTNFLGFRTLITGAISDAQRFGTAFRQAFGIDLRRTDPISATLQALGSGFAAINLQGISRWFDQLSVSSHALWLQLSALAQQVLPSLNAAWREFGLANDHVVTAVQALLAGNLPGAMRQWRAALMEVGFAWSDLSTAIGKVATIAGGIMATIGAWVLNVGIPKITGDIAGIASAVWDWVQNTAWPAVQNAARTLGSLAVKIGGWLVSSAEDLWSKVSSWIQAQLPAITGLARDIGDVAIKIGHWLVSAGEDLWSKVSSWIAAQLPSVAGFARDIGSIAIKIGHWLVSAGEDLFSTVVAWIAAHAVQIKGYVHDLGTLYLKVGRWELTALGDVASQIGQQIQGINWSNAFQGAAEAIGLGLAAALSKGIPTMLNLMSGVMEHIDYLQVGRAIGDGIARAVGAMVEFGPLVALNLIKNMSASDWASFGTAVARFIFDAIDTAINAPTLLLIGIIEGVYNAFKPVGEEIATAIGEGLHSAWDKVVQEFLTGIDQMISQLNGVIDAINAVLKALGAPTVPSIPLVLAADRIKAAFDAAKHAAQDAMKVLGVLNQGQTSNPVTSSTSPSNQGGTNNPKTQQGPVAQPVVTTPTPWFPTPQQIANATTGIAGYNTELGLTTNQLRELQGTNNQIWVPTAKQVANAREQQTQYGAALNRAIPVLTGMAGAIGMTRQQQQALAQSMSNSNQQSARMLEMLHVIPTELGITSVSAVQAASGFASVGLRAAAAASGIGTFAARTVSSVASTAGLSAAASAAGAAIGRFAAQAATSAASAAVFGAQLAGVKARVDSFTAGVTSGMQAAVAAVASAGASIRAAAELIGLSLAAAGTQGGLAFANGIGLGALQAAADMAGAGAAIEGVANSITGALTAAGAAAGGGFANGIALGMLQAAAAAAQGVAAIASICSGLDLFGPGFATGASFSSGVAAGILSNLGAVQAAASTIVSAAAAAAAATAIIRSPSHLFRDKIGVPIAQGVAVGIREGAAFVKDAASSLISLPSLPSTYTASGAISGASGGITVNPTIVVNVDGSYAGSVDELAAQVAEKIGPVLVHIGTQIRRGQGALR